MAFSISGLASGLDWQTMISQLVELQSRPITLLEDNKDDLSDKKSAWSELNTKLVSLRTSAGSLSSLDDFDLFTPTSSITGTSSDVEDFIDVAIGSNATEGTYSIVINNLATAEKQTSTGFSSSSDALGISGDLTINDRVASIVATDSLADIQTKVNALNSGEDPADVTASILAVSDSEYRLTLTSKDTGATGMTITDGTGSLGLTEVVAGEDAEITVDGFTITRSTNQITDVLSGVTLDLLSEDAAATITLNVNRDYDGVKENIQGFVDSYNEVMSYISTQNTLPGEDEDPAALFGDNSLQSVKSSIRDVILSEVSGLDSELNYLSRIGIHIDRTGQLSIDDDELDEYLETNFEDVMNLFAANGTSTSTDLTYIYSTSNTMIEGDYDVEITQAATQAATVGSGFSGTLISDATLTLTSSGGTEEEIVLSAGWDIADIVDAINSGNTIGVVAANNAGQLSLTSSSYGTPGNFTVAGINAELGIADDTYTGLDVAGRIREQGDTEWMTMTGSGQSLTGDDDQDAEGLVIKYTGTGTGILDFTFTKGVGEKLDQVIYSMTDSIDGYVAGKQDSLQRQMDNIDEKIEGMEVRLTKYQETLIAKYSAMESMLSTLQSQMSWLTSQISVLGGTST